MIIEHRIACLLVDFDCRLFIVFYLIAFVMNSQTIQLWNQDNIFRSRVRYLTKNHFISRAAAMKTALLLSSWSDIICMINKDPDRGWFNLSAHNIHAKFIRRIFCVSHLTSRAINLRGARKKDKGGVCIFITFLISILLFSNYDRLIYASCRWNMPFFWIFPQIANIWDI